MFLLTSSEDIPSGHLEWSGDTLYVSALKKKKGQNALCGGMWALKANSHDCKLLFPQGSLSPGTKHRVFTIYNPSFPILPPR